ncbi:MAG TPA: patatin-like phospholipase family protein [Chloroflexia bacterium]|nr:patatin-like phospholipase family protein [Chloroflexia bacterium]
MNDTNMTGTGQAEDEPQAQSTEQRYTAEEAASPVTRIESDPVEVGDAIPVAGMEQAPGVTPRLTPGVALCLSGGGYRAMLFHLGALWRLNELGYLAKLSRVSSVSGGSITSGVLAMAWDKLDFSEGGVLDARQFNEEVVRPLRKLASKTIDIWSVLGGLFLGGTVSTYVSAYYKRYVFDDFSLKDLPAPGSGPDFIFNASNLQSGVLWQFSRGFAGDYRVGWLRNPDVSVARAVAASSAFPPFLAPATFKFDPKTQPFKRGRNSDLNCKPYTTNVLLVDGGVYDNLGLETAWKYYDTVLVSDGGGKMPPMEKPWRDWVSQFLRVRDMTDNQVRALRKRQLIASYEADEQDAMHRLGAFWGIRSKIANYEQPDALECPPEDTEKLAGVQTGLRRLTKTTQERLINWGYAICDTAMRKHVIDGPTPPPQFPYPKAKVG